MWRVTKTAEQKIGVQFAVHPTRRSAHSSPRQAPLCFIINNNTTCSVALLAAIGLEQFTSWIVQRPAHAHGRYTRSLPSHLHGCTCHLLFLFHPPGDRAQPEGKRDLVPLDTRPRLFPSCPPCLHCPASSAERPPGTKSCCPFLDQVQEPQSLAPDLERASASPLISGAPLSPQEAPLPSSNLTRGMWGTGVTETPNFNLPLNR